MRKKLQQHQTHSTCLVHFCCWQWNPCSLLVGFEFDPWEVSTNVPLRWGFGKIFQFLEVTGKCTQPSIQAAAFVCYTVTELMDNNNNKSLQSSGRQIMSVTLTKKDEKVTAPRHHNSPEAGLFRLILFSFFFFFFFFGGGCLYCRYYVWPCDLFSQKDIRFYWAQLSEWPKNTTRDTDHHSSEFQVFILFTQFFTMHKLTKANILAFKRLKFLSMLYWNSKAFAFGLLLLI